MIHGCTPVEFLPLHNNGLNPAEIPLVYAGQPTTTRKSTAHSIDPPGQLTVEEIPQKRDVGAESPDCVDGNDGRWPTGRERHPSDLDTVGHFSKQRQIDRPNLFFKKALVDRDDGNLPPSINERSTNCEARGARPRPERADTRMQGTAAAAGGSSIGDRSVELSGFGPLGLELQIRLGDFVDIALHPHMALMKPHPLSRHL